MSSPSTPSRQHGPSSTSTPSTTSHGSPSGELTPKSKVRALLAAIDNDSDVEIEAGRNGNAERGDLGGALGHPTSNSERISGSDEGKEDADDEDALPIVPKGRLAARMLGKKDKVAEVEQRGESAYEKVKRQLMRGAKGSGEGSTILSKEKDKPVEPSSEEDGRISDAAARRREKRRLARTSHQGTPTSTGRQSPRSSPGLFLSPGLGSTHKEAEAVAAGSNGSDSDLPTRPTENSRFLALVARKREERLAKEEAESRKKAEREAQLKALSKHKHPVRESSPVVGSEDESDGNAGGRRLTQHARPTRKASKKALEEMNRETQRMSRNMQLAHQARTKKKITKESFFAKFNFKPLGGVPTDTRKAPSSSTAASSAAVSDAEGLQLRETPPTSPVTGEDSGVKMDAGQRDSVISFTEQSTEIATNPDEELPTIKDVMTQPVHRLDKGKGKVSELKKSPMEKKKAMFSQHPVKDNRSTPLAQLGNRMVDSDSDLEIVADPAIKPKKTDVFDRLPAEKPTDARSLLTLRALANLASPGKQNSKTKASMTPGDLQTCLRKRARQQAAIERAEKLQQLRDKGIIVQTAEERQRDQAEVEDLVEKARREAEEIMKEEKDAAKKEGKDSGKTDGLDDTSDEDDEEYVDDVEEERLELSGSDEEEEEGSNDDEEEVEGHEDVEDDEEDKLAMNEDSKNMGALIDQEASEDEEEAQEDTAASEDDEDQAATTHNRRKTKNARVIPDDDDDENDGDTTPARCSPEGAAFAQNPFIPGLPTSAGMPLGLTQAFAATMADSQSQVDDIVMADSLGQEQDSLTFLRGMPEPNFPDFDTTIAQDPVRDSQLSQTRSRVEESQETSIRPGIDLHYSQSQIRYDSMLDTQRMPTATQFSELPDPTQDVGFAISSPPAGQFYEEPPSTVDTVLISGVEKEPSPVIKKKGRLRRRAEAICVLADAEQDTLPVETEGDFVISPNVFDVMRKAAQKPAPIVNNFDKKKSEAKGMVEEQAEESEDEYAGLGGASDDDSGGSEDEEMQKMIDESDVKVDERKLAAFYADKERASDAKAVEKLFKDMNSGLLRRKRGADIDLSDDSDDGEARRRRKQREFAKMRKALLADENLGKIAENPKKLAFLRAIEDREKDGEDLDDGLDFLDRAPDEDALQDSQTGAGDADSQSQSAAPGMKRKRPLEDSVPDSANRRPPPHLRRVQKSKKPATLAEIRESVSFLLEEPHAEAPVALGLESSDVEENDNHNLDDNDNDDTGDHQAPRSPNPNPATTHRRRRPTNTIIDRIALKRASASTGSSTTKLAFHDPSTAASLPSAFRVPSLLRRTTTQGTGISEASYGVTERMATATATVGVGSTGGEKMKMGGSKKSSINYFARERERRKVVEGRGREREVGRLRVAVRERKGVLGVLGGGRWG